MSPVREVQRRHIAIDLGASSGRVLEVGVGGRTLEAREVHRFAHAPRRESIARVPTWCWEFGAIWEGVLTGLSAAARGGPVDSIGVDSWAVDYGLVDEAGGLVLPLRAYRDPRTTETFRELRASIGDWNLYQRTGVQFQPFNTLYQLAADGRDPARPLERATRILMIPDLIANRLCGSTVGERTNASTSQLLDVHDGRWITEFASAAGIPGWLLPELVEAGNPRPLGALTDEVAARTGLPRTTPVLAVATHDTASAVIAAPIDPRTDAYVSSGTWSLVGLELPHAVVSQEAMRANLTNERGGFGTFRFLKNVTGLWLLQECAREFAAAGNPRSWADLERMAADEPPSLNLFDTEDPSLLEPGGMPGRILALFQSRGLPAPEGEAALIRCVLESLARSTAGAVRRAAELGGRRLERIVVVGGGAGNALLNQLIADAAGMPVAVGPIECTAIGNGLMQFAALEGISAAGPLREMVRRLHPCCTFEPRPGRERAAHPGDLDSDSI